MSFNTWLSNADWRAVAQEIERHDPDILALVEFGSEKGPLLDVLASRYPHRTDCLEKPYCHMALLSKFAIRSTESRALWQGPPQIVARFGSELANLTVVGVHTLRPPHFRSQFTQMRALARQLVRIGGTRIVMGDFNATPFSRMARTFSRRSGLTRITSLPTWPSRFAGLPQIAIDHIFLSPDLKVVGRVRIGNSAGSDHYPVIADILLPTSPLSKTAVWSARPAAGRQSNAFGN
jgi:endonuclease/exonuclease/phosphatase (EEP) superfamily protein YafD